MTDTDPSSVNHQSGDESGSGDEGLFGQENRLSEESSPYLLQHQHNPVFWLPWGDEAFELARRLNKPVLLSVGYSACHWCHVMAHESFDDPDSAGVMNDLFINIKVDREERPDIDDVYQTSHQLLTGRPGGWPLTVFLCPKTRLPFIAGTYFPKESAYGRIGFQDLMQRVSDFYHNQGGEFTKLRNQVRQGFDSLAGGDEVEPASSDQLSVAVINKAAETLLSSAEPRYGGFGGAPKFPMPSNLERLFFAGEHDGPLAERARQHLQFTLRRMLEGGVCDHINGGFFRYSTDEKWMIPHFEKMLYDNGPLLSVYAEAYSLFNEYDFEWAARGIARWVIDEMRSPEGGFYCALDADSEGREGLYYLWREGEVKQLLSTDEYALFNLLYGLEEPPNFDDGWHLHQQVDWHETIAQLGVEESHAQTLYVQGKAKLLAARQQKTRPHMDIKILCSWNALMIRGLAMSARIFEDQEYLAVAQRTVDFIRENLWINQRLFASWQQGRTKLTGYLDDYVFLMDALLELLQVQWRDEDYRFLIGLAESVMHNFEDPEQGGFYFTSHDHEALIHRNKPLYDNVMPSGNGVAAKVFGRLGHLAAEPRYLECARNILQSAWSSVQQQPQAHHNLLIALDELMSSPTQVLLKGNEKAGDWQQQIRLHFGERIHCYWVPDEAEFQPPAAMPLEHNQGVICVGEHCLQPQQSLVGLMAQLSSELEGKKSEIPGA